MTEPMISVRHLRKVYTSTVAVADVTLRVEPGEIFGLIGPNGAGKTTTIECLEGHRVPDSGDIKVCGLDPQLAGAELRQRIGIQLQESNLPQRLRVWEAMDLFASFYQRSVDWRPIVNELGLGEKLRSPFAKLSGGQKQRLFIALALVNDPEVVFLDELTTGLDPQARQTVWDLILEIRAQGKTILLTTHLMDDAERLCDRVAILDRGEVVALDTPKQLIQAIQKEVTLLLDVEGDVDLDVFRSLPGVTSVMRNSDALVVRGREDGLVSTVVRHVEADGYRLRSLQTERATLDDVFLALTGRNVAPTQKVE